MTDLYLWSIRRNVRFIRSLLGTVLGTQISCRIPERLFLPHPYGIIVGGAVQLGNNVTLMQQVTLGAKDPWCAKEDISDEYPKLGDGVYVGAGAKILGRINVGEWAIIGANAVVTKDIPAAATVVGYNQIIGAGQTETSKQATAELDTKLR